MRRFAGYSPGGMWKRGFEIVREKKSFSELNV
jgi:hypothetical protein